MTDETFLEALHERAEAHLRRYPRRPWRLCWAAASPHLSHLNGVYASYVTRERAEAARERLEARASADEEIVVPMVYWTEERR